MATSSITKNFVISGKEQVEMFVNAIEESAKNRPVHIPVAAREIKGESDALCTGLSAIATTTPSPPLPTV